MMGDILRTGDREVSFEIDIVPRRPIERIEIRNGLAGAGTVAPVRGEGTWGGASGSPGKGFGIPGRGRQSVWDGGAEASAATRSKRVSPINMWNLDKKSTRVAPDELKWTALNDGRLRRRRTSSLGDANSGTLSISPPPS